MTDLLTRPASRSAPLPPRGRPLPLVAFCAAACAAGVGLAAVTVVVLLAWSTDPASAAGASVAMHAAGHAWLLSSGVPLTVPGGRLGLVPLGAAVLPAALLWRAGVAVAKAAQVADRAAAALATAVLAGTYGVLAALLAALAATPAVRTAPLRALAGGVILAAAAGGAGVLRQTGLGGALVGRLPSWVPGLGPPIAAGLLVLAGTGALLVGTSLGWHAGRSGELIRALAPGGSGGVGLFAIDLLLLPNAVVWAACFAVGPGFAVGAGTSVTPFAVSLGALPAVPLLTALPAGGRPPLLALAALLGPLLAGAVIGAVVVRRSPHLHRRPAALTAAASGVGAGLVLALAGWLAGGPVGPGRLAVTGPSPWQVGLAAALELAPVGAAVAWWRCGRNRPESALSG